MKLGLRFGAVFAGIFLAAACGGGDDGGGSGGSSGGGGTSGGGTSGGGGSGATGGGGSGGTGGATGGTGGSGGTSTGGTAGSASGGGGSTGGTAGAASGGGGAGGGGGSAGMSDLAECKAKAATSSDPVCGECACDNCLAELKDCEADPTCVALRTCALAKGCCDEICVLLQCGTELNAAGGINGPGTTKAKAIKDCTIAAQCTCCK